MTFRIPRPPAVFCQDGTARMPIRDPRSPGGWAWSIVDGESVEKYGSLPWSLSNHGYAMYSRYRGKNITKEGVQLHRLVVNAPPASDGLVVDHINRNPLDNRRSNLRITNDCINMQNSRIQKNNKSGCRGVHFMKKIKRWKAEIKANRVWRYLGVYKTKEDAIAVRKAAEAIYHREALAHAV